MITSSVLPGIEPQKVGYSRVSKKNSNNRQNQNVSVAHSDNSLSALHASSVNFASIQKTRKPAAIINFGGNKDKNKVIYVGAEMPPYFKVGGVATVMNDYEGIKIMPYYNGKIKYDPATGNPKADEKPEIHKLQDGTPIFTNADLSKQSMEEVIREGNYHKLELVGSKQMSWGLDDQDDIAIYKVAPKQSDIDKAVAAGKEAPKQQEHYMVYTDATAKMPKPYADNSYSFGYKDLAPDVANWQGNGYAKFDKALVELLPDTKLDAETIVCSDQQSAYIPHYMAKKALGNDPYFQDMKPTYVKHNVGPGYTGATSPQQMFVNLCESPDQIKAVKADPKYTEALQNGTTNDYFRQFIAETIDDRGSSPNATMIPLKYHAQGYVAAATTVSEEYHAAVASNAMVAPEIQKTEAELSKNGKSGGILNPLNDPNVDPYKPIPLPGYGQAQEITLKDGTKETVQPMKVFTPEMTLDQMIATKKENKKNLFARLSGKYDQPIIVTGTKNGQTKLWGHIDQKWTDKINKGEDVKLFVSWGRGDFQKGLDTVLSAFEQHAQTPEGQNSVLVLGGSMDDTNPEAKNIKLKVKGLLADKNLQGRVCFMEGFAPGYALASAADAAVFPSRFAPCELTDLEAMKYFCTPITTNAQGLKQKNPDPRSADEKEKLGATSYRTTHEYQMGPEQLKTASAPFKTEYDKLLAVEDKKLTLRGVDAAKKAEIAAKNVEGSNEFQALYREHADNVISDELATAMKEVATATPERADLLYQNQKKLKTGWDNNGALHPSKKTSRQLYKELHFDPEPQKPQKSLFNFDNALLENLKNKAAAAANAAENAAENAVNGAENAGKDAGKDAEKAGKEVGNGKLALIGVAGAAVGALGVYLLRPKQKQATNAQGDSFQSRKSS